MSKHLYLNKNSVDYIIQNHNNLKFAALFADINERILRNNHQDVHPIQFSTCTFLSKLKWNSIPQKMQDKD